MVSRTRKATSELSQESIIAALFDPATPVVMPGLVDRPLPDLIVAFMAELAQANRSPHTVRAYSSDLRHFLIFAGELPVGQVTHDLLRLYGQHLANLAPASRARQQATLASFFRWLVRHDLVEKNPMDKLERVKKPERLPRPVEHAKVETVLATIPTQQYRDRLLFRLIYETGLRITETLGIHVEDLTLAQDDERLLVTGKGDRQRTVLLDDPMLVRLLRAYLKRTGIRHGLLFRPAKNGTGGPLRYQSIQERWAAYCRQADIRCTIHQLRHSHATELLNGGASVVTVKKRLGHKDLKTTMQYAELSDARADEEVRMARRKRS